MKRTLTLCLILLFAGQLFAQNNVRLTINHKLGDNDFAFNTQSQNDLNNVFEINRLEYYISGISITHDGGTTTDVSDIYILAQANKSDTFELGNLNITTIEAINFSIGVDPGENNGDPSRWSSSHALSPKSPSMHWGWSAGYRFVALEGYAGSNLTQSMQIHALGNSNYFEQSIPVSGDNVNGDLVITLNADYNMALSNINVSAGVFEHSDRKEAAECLRNFQTKVFTNNSGEGNTLSVEDIAQTNFAVAPNPSNGEVKLMAADPLLNGGKINVINMLGEVVYTGTLTGIEHSLNIERKGIYSITIENDGVAATEKLMVL